MAYFMFQVNYNGTDVIRREIVVFLRNVEFIKGIVLIFLGKVDLYIRDE
jgi:hypothetical protein